MNKGLTTPNAQWRDWTAEETNGLNDLAPETIVWILYDITTEQKFNHKLQTSLYCQAHPGTIVICRCYDANSMSKNPIEWSKECKTRLDWASAGVAGLFECLPANEVNLAIERGGSATDPNREDWGDQAAWLQAFAADWEALGSPYPIHCPALSPSGAYQQGMNEYAQNGVYADFDVADVHVYDTAQLADIDNIPIPAGQPLTVSEFNRLDPATFFNRADRARDKVYFILGGDGWAEDDLLKLPTVYASFKNWNQGGHAMPDPTPTPQPPATVDPVQAQVLAQNSLITAALKAFRLGKFTGADGMDGYISALQGGAPFVGTYPPKA